MSKTVLVINIGMEQQPLVENLFDRGYKVYAIHHSDDYDPHPFEDVLVCDYDDIGQAYAFIEDLKLDGILSDQCDYSNVLQSELSEKLDLPTHTITSTLISSNKDLQRSISKTNNIKIPEFCIVSKKEELSQINIPFPVIVKPTYNRGSIGVSVATDKDSLAKAFEFSSENSPTGYSIVERFIEGTEFTVDGYCFDSGVKTVAVAKKMKLGVDSQVSTDIEYSPDIDEILYQRLVSNNEIVINKLGYTFGFTHSEYLVDSEGDIYLVEAANRGGGMFTSEIIVPHVSGLDLLNKYIDDCLGIENNIEIDIKRNPTILKFFTFKPGKVAGISGVESLEVSDKILKLGINIKVGDEINPAIDDSKRHGFIIYSSDTNLREGVVDVMNKIKITYEY
jgi:hypothetical protein